MTILGDLLDLVLPRRCVGCGAAAGPLCPACQGLLGGAPRRCLPVSAPPGLPVPWAAARYEGAVRCLIVAYKERGAAHLASPLGTALARVVLAAADGDAVLVPVPSLRGAVRRRGYDSTRRLALATVAELHRRGGRARSLSVLTHARDVADQAALTAAQRRANLTGALVVARPERVRDADLVVVDDVITTGATAAEAARALRAAGARVRTVATVAATVRRDRRERSPSAGYR